MSRLISVMIVCLVAVMAPSAWSQQEPSQAANLPGPNAAGFLLPNGWRLTPAGEQVPLTDLPLNILTTADGKYALVATSGYNAHELSVIELATGKKAAVE